jgi:hypothetical protein
MVKPTLLPDPTCLHLKLLDASDTAITAVVITTALKAACPVCQAYSDRVHSRYVRRVADLPWMGCAVRLELHVRRFFCSNPECKRQIFTERLPSMVAPYARRTTRLTDLLTLIGFALGGKQESAWRQIWACPPALTPCCGSFGHNQRVSSPLLACWE